MTPARQKELAEIGWKPSPGCNCKFCSEWDAHLIVQAKEKADFRADELGPKRASTESERRKATPIFSGVLRYFPDALAAIARVSKAGNDKHNPGEPLHWAREKSTDHGDCIARHQITFDSIDDETNEYHAAAVAWRALAQLQLLEEKRNAAMKTKLDIIWAKPAVANNGGWNNYSPGGIAPGASTRVDVILRIGTLLCGEPANSLRWTEIGAGTIAKWRPARP